MIYKMGIVVIAAAAGLGGCNSDESAASDAADASTSGGESSGGGDAGVGLPDASTGGTGGTSAGGEGGSAGNAGPADACACEIDETTEPHLAVTTLECVCDAFDCPGFEAQVATPFCPDGGVGSDPTVMQGCGYTIFRERDNYYVYQGDALELVAIQAVQDFEPAPPCGVALNRAPTGELIPECDEYTTCSLCPGAEEPFCEL